MKRILPLLLLPLVVSAADEYAGAQLPIVFAGPKSFVHDYKHDAHELIDRRFIFLDNYTGKIDEKDVHPIYDAGSPKLVTSILIQGAGDNEFYNTSRLGKFRVYGSNDMANWTLFWEGHSMTVGNAEYIRLVRDPATGASSAWKLVKPSSAGQMPVMATAEKKADYDDSAYPCATRYRYYRIEPSPDADFRTVNAAEFSLWTPE